MTLKPSADTAQKNRIRELLPKIGAHRRGKSNEQRHSNHLNALLGVYEIRELRISVQNSADLEILKIVVLAFPGIKRLVFDSPTDFWDGTENREVYRVLIRCLKTVDEVNAERTPNGFFAFLSELKPRKITLKVTKLVSVKETLEYFESSPDIGEVAVFISKEKHLRYPALFKSLMMNSNVKVRLILYS